jgi:hypothetical protein
MIGGAAIFLSKQTPYPGFYALLPVLGAGAVLWPLGRNTLVSRVLASKFLVFIGAISYSLYLFHWPIIVFWRHYISFAPLTTGEQVAIIALSFLVSWASWLFVEQRYRWCAASRRVVFTSAAAAVFLLAGVNIAIFASSGIPQRIPDSVKAISSREIMWDWTCPHEVRFSEEEECVVGHNWKDARFHIALWGDSNAAHILPILDRALAGRDASAVFFFTCSPVVQIDGAQFFHPDKNYTSACDRVRTNVIESINKHSEISLVILSSAWSTLVLHLIRNDGDAPDAVAGLKILEASLHKTVSMISARNRDIIVISDIPRWLHDPLPCVLSQQTALLRRKCQKDITRIDRSFFEQFHKPTHDLLRRQSQKSGFTVISPEDKLCNNSGCTTIIGGEFIYLDEGHLRRNLKPETLAELEEFLNLSTTIDQHIQKMSRPEEIGKANN